MPSNQTAGASPSGANPHAVDLAAPGVDEPGDLAGATDDLDPQRDDDPANNTDPGQSEDTIPPRLRGKSEAQIVEEFARLESEYGRQGNELGETRALLREFLEKTLQPANNAESDNNSENDLDENLDEDQARAVKGYVDKRVNTLEKEVVETKRALSRSEFARQHPKYTETAKSREFLDWVESSKYRTSLFKKADDYNWDAADELFSGWDEHQAANAVDGPDGGEPSDATKQKRALRRNSTETGGAGGKSGNLKKTFKSADLIRLYNEDREKYNAMSSEIQQAFAEGRVK